MFLYVSGSGGLCVPYGYDRFFVDFEGNLADAAVKNAIRGLREEALNLKILGNY